MLWPQEEGIRPIHLPVRFEHHPPAALRVEWGMSGAQAGFISGAFFFGYMLDKSKLPPPQGRDDVEIVPEWWPDPPFVLHEWEKWLEIVVDPSLQQHGELELQSDRRLQWDLLTPERTVLKSSARLNGTRNKVDVKDLAPGKYLLRVSRDAQAATRFEAEQRAVVKFGVGPAF